MKIYLDDLRENPYPDYVLVRSAEEAIELIKTGEVTHISFDHDLGPPELGDGYGVAKVIEELAHEKAIPKMEWQIHSANPRGQKDIYLAMKSAERFWD